MLALYILHIATNIAHMLEMIAEGSKTGFVILGTHRQSGHDFYVGGAI